MSLSKEQRTTETQETGSILDILHEKICNVEQSTNKHTITDALNDVLKQLAKRERINRDSTITLLNNDQFDHNKIIMELETKWCEGKNEPAITFWHDKTHTYCQFITPLDKHNFLDFLTMNNNMSSLRELLVKPSAEGFYFIRRPVRLEINMVKSNIKTEMIKNQLIKILGKEEAIVDLKESKTNALTKSRNIYLKVQATAFLTLFKYMDGILPYANKESNTRTRLYLKINAKPWQCRDCYAYATGVHQCQGKVCAQCGNKGHDIKECKSKTKFCPNCKRRGHKAKEPHCLTYLNELAKEIRKFDIPLEFFEEKDLRYVLAKSISLK